MTLEEASSSISQIGVAIPMKNPTGVVLTISLSHGAKLSDQNSLSSVMGERELQVEAEE